MQPCSVDVITGCIVGCPCQHVTRAYCNPMPCPPAAQCCVADLLCTRPRACMAHTWHRHRLRVCFLCCGCCYYRHSVSGGSMTRTPAPPRRPQRFARPLSRHGLPCITARPLQWPATPGHRGCMSGTRTCSRRSCVRECALSSWTRWATIISKTLVQQLTTSLWHGRPVQLLQQLATSLWHDRPVQLLQ